MSPRLPRDPATGSEVLIVGAGFSRAISEHLLVADELGQCAYDLLAKSDPLFRGGRPVFSGDYPFESYLSLLADNQPHLSEAANRENAARFAKLTEAIASVLSGVQDKALLDEAPAWFYQLLSALHCRRTTVVTFNYDTLIEAGLASHYLQPAGTDSIPAPAVEFDEPLDLQPIAIAARITVDDVLRGQPPLSRPGQMDWDPLPVTFRLLKLHGSLDWWWVPGDPTGSTLNRQHQLGTFGFPVAVSDEQRQDNLPGREPFIVPPMATKSAYYRNPVTRQLWQDAAAALATADRIALIGYSLPVTDLVTAGMLESALRDRKVAVDVVNTTPVPVSQRLAALGGPPLDSDDLRVYAHDEEATCMERFVAALCDRASADVIRGTAGLLGRSSDPVAVTWSKGDQPSTRRVASITSTEDGAVVLVTDDQHLFATTVRTGQPAVPEVVERLAGASRLFAQTPDGHRAPIVGYSAPHFNDPNAVHLLDFTAAGQILGR